MKEEIKQAIKRDKQVHPPPNSREALINIISGHSKVLRGGRGEWQDGSLPVLGLVIDLFSTKIQTASGSRLIPSLHYETCPSFSRERDKKSFTRGKGDGRNGGGLVVAPAKIAR